MKSALQPEESTPFFRKNGSTHELRRVPDAGAVSKGLFNDLFVRGPILGGDDRVTRPYEQAATFHAAVYEFATSVASLKLRFWYGEPDDENAREVEDGHALPARFSRPNPWQTWSQFSEAGVIHRMQSGEDLWLLIGADGEPLDLEEGHPVRIADVHAIWPVPGDAADLDFDSLGRPKLWRIRVADGAARKAVKLGAVVQFRNYTPHKPFRGLAAADVASRDIHLEWQAYRYNEAILRNGGDPGGTYLVDGDPPVREEQEAAERQVNDKHKVENAGRKRVVYGKSLTYHPHPIAPKDFSFGEMLSYGREQQASVVGVPLPAIGILEDATLANLDASLIEKWRKVGVYLRSVEDTINGHLLPRVPEARGVVARFDLSPVEALRRDREALLRLAKDLSIDTGGTFNEALEMVGAEVDPFPGGDVAFASSGLSTVERVLDPPEPPPMAEAPPEDDDTDDADLEGDAAEDRAAATTERGLIQWARRREWYRAHEDRIRRPAEDGIFEDARAYIDRYTKAQLKRLKDFVRDGDLAVAASAKNVPPIDLPASALTVDFISPLLVSPDEWAEKLLEALGARIDSVFLASANAAAQEIGAASALSLDNPLVQALLEEQKRLLAGSVTQTLGKDVSRAILEALDGSETVGTLQEIVRQHLPAIENSVRGKVNPDARAARIARTEAGHAGVAARYETFVRQGVKRIEWVSSGDAFVRDDPDGGHVHLDGKTVEIGSEFRGEGGTPIAGLIHPLAHGAPAAQVVNCRCDIVAVIEEDSDE